MESSKKCETFGLTFSATSYTYMERHGVPSAGDWALDRFGAIYLQGTESVTFDSCIFDRLDGNGVMISGYNRNATISHSDFSFIGGNAMAAWGYTNETSSDPGRPGVVIENAPEAGVDGTDGNHPRIHKLFPIQLGKLGCMRNNQVFSSTQKLRRQLLLEMFSSMVHVLVSILMMDLEVVMLFPII